VTFYLPSLSFSLSFSSFSLFLLHFLFPSVFIDCDSSVYLITNMINLIEGMDGWVCVTVCFI
jgi:UDP-N-acetylmuramyl pentapeptide phosphotransferase/UDP-N-acetylglucosamine-1-phosphate transferase